MSGMYALRGELKVINVGSSHFHDQLRRQGVRSIQVNWRPPVELEDDLQDILKEVL
jgi:hypothetical protein